MKGGIKSIYSSKYELSLYELLKTYAYINMQRSFQRVNIPKLPVLTTEKGINNIRDQIKKIQDWKNIVELIPKNFKDSVQKKRTGLSGILAASLELTKEGLISIKQDKSFDKIYIKKTDE